MVQWPWPPGTIVVCVEEDEDAHIKLNEYYTIKRCYDEIVNEDDEYFPGVEIVESIPDTYYYCFAACCFRPAESTHSETIKETVCLEPQLG